MKVYALLFKSLRDGPRLPSETMMATDKAISLHKNEFEDWERDHPLSWMVYELELDEKELCDT